MLSPEIEELLEALYVCEEEQGRYPQDEARSAAADESVAHGFVERCEAGLRLTAAGRELGQDVVRRHRLAECLLHDVLGAKDEFVDADACRFEHVLQYDLAEKVCLLLGHPRACPHGNRIPPGPCCRAAQSDGIHEVTPLCDGRPGSEGAVAYLATRDKHEVQKMMALGILPGAPVKLIQRFPSYVFQVGYSQFAVDLPLASVIYVRWNRLPAAATA